MRSPPPLLPPVLKFIGRFSNGTFCVIETEDRPPGEGRTIRSRTEWPSPQPRRSRRRSFLAEWQRWRLERLQILAAHWEVELEEHFNLPAQIGELWACRPGEAPRLIRKVGIWKEVE